MMKLEQGNTYKFSMEKEEQIGKYISEDKEHIFIKLDSGYNIGIKKNRIQKTDLQEKKKETKIKKTKYKTNSKLQKITILHTGGTVASKVDYSTGAVIAQFSPEEIIELFPELKQIANIESKLVGNMQSEMMRFDHYNVLAEEIKKEAEKGVDGIIITHGTDTLHVTAAALTFSLENLRIPIILVGSQRSSDRPSSDAASNLIAAAKFISQTDYCGVSICMHKNTSDNEFKIIKGIKARKMHTSRRDAFKAINEASIATVNLEKDTIIKHKETSKKDKKQKITIKKFDPKLKIGIIRPHTNMYAEEYTFYKNYDGLIIELFGIGHLPTMKTDKTNSENEKILEEIQTLCKKMPVIGTPQTINGRIDMNVYSPGKQLINAGMLGNYHDTPTDTAFIKLAWLLSNYDKEDVKTLYNENFRGEISERSEEKDY
ncbi:Glu-tRNA(Gln) amidotransferase subunit GatD [Candidatus Woesearchaeota archaeon]|nr:Glu-tRNA(Gln) amidotransferase subunit GatD [Candidatus Woesearchaeota archaeon]MCF7900835.1 Glu-tRNA(Gln) amidotransferase subunit GatD [Candidatus Woesearchaeota archaeon]